jgi:5-methylcytosine-specific restriction protein A
VLEAKAGTTERIRGRAWMATRQRVALAHGYRCAGCGCVWVPSRDQIDHTIPLEQGGGNEDSNLKPLCNACHEAKTAGEATRRARW